MYARLHWHWLLSEFRCTLRPVASGAPVGRLTPRARAASDAATRRERVISHGDCLAVAPIPPVVEAVTRPRASYLGVGGVFLV